jgi:hypothetical protein
VAGKCFVFFPSLFFFFSCSYTPFFSPYPFPRSLDDFIDHRLGRDARHPYIYHAHPSPTTPPTSTADAPSSTHGGPSAHAEAHPHWPPPNPIPTNSASGRKRLFRALQEERRKAAKMGIPATSTTTATVFDGDVKEKLRAVHLLSAEEIKELFRDVVEGLFFLVRVMAFLLALRVVFYFFILSFQHQRSILHLDLKPGNVLLTWDEGKLMCVQTLDFYFSSPYAPPDPARCYLTLEPLRTCSIPTEFDLGIPARAPQHLFPSFLSLTPSL